VGVKGDLLTSLDGQTWTTDNFNIAASPLKVVWVNHRLITLFLVGNYFLTSPDDPTPISAPMARGGGGLSLRVAASRLFVTLPIQRDRTARAAIYGIAGGKVADVPLREQGNGGSRETEVPIDGWARGLYLFRLEGPEAVLARPFVIAP
jgi:hypothetical protein